MRITRSWLHGHFRELAPTQLDDQVVRQALWQRRHAPRRPDRPLLTLPRGVGLGLVLGVLALAWGGWPRPEVWIRLAGAACAVLGGGVIAYALYRMECLYASGFSFVPPHARDKGSRTQREVIRRRPDDSHALAAPIPGVTSSAAAEGIVVDAVPVQPPLAGGRPLILRSAQDRAAANDRADQGSRHCSSPPLPPAVGGEPQGEDPRQSRSCADLEMQRRVLSVVRSNTPGGHTCPVPAGEEPGVPQGQSGSARRSPSSSASVPAPGPNDAVQVKADLSEPGLTAGRAPAARFYREGLR